MGNEYSKKNELAWNQMAYDAWCYRFGEPHEAAEDIKSDPKGRIANIYKYLGEVGNKKIINLLGSNGTKGVALALLGADVTVVDIASENARYAGDLARAAGVNIRFIVSDVLELPQEELNESYDIVILELGVLHYFLDLTELFRIISKLLRKEGKMVLQDFHPVSTKLIQTKGKKHKINGDYFDDSIQETDVAYMKYVPGMEDLSEEDKSGFHKAYLRKWTLGEIVTSAAGEGLCIKLLEEAENPRPEDKGIPKLFTLVAEKI